jgi:hypothetical protein
MKIPKRGTQVFCLINILSLIIGFCSVAGAQDQQTVKKLQQLIEQPHIKLSTKIYPNGSFKREWNCQLPRPKLS